MKAVVFIFLNAAVVQVFSQCSPQNVHFPQVRTEIERSSSFLVEVVADKCAGLNEFYYDWVLRDVLTLEIIKQSSTNHIYVDGMEFDGNKIFNTEYEVLASVSHYPDMTAASYNSFVFHFTPSPMFIRFVGGDEKTHIEKTDLQINALDESTDRSYIPKEHPFAGNIIEWFIDPPLPGLNTKSLILNIPGERLTLGDTYNFTVKVTRTKIKQFIDIKSASQIVKIVSKESPECVIKCERNCQNSRTTDSTVFKATCLKNCVHVTFRWLVRPQIEPMKTEFGDGFGHLVIHPTAFKVGDNVAVTVDCHKVFSSYYLNFEDTITIGTCSVTPDHGVSGVTPFTISCVGFKAVNGSLTYIIYQMSDDGNNIILNEHSTLDKNVVYLSEGTPAVIRIRVVDESFRGKELEISAQVEPYAPRTNMSKIEAIKRLVLTDEHNSLAALSMEMHRNQVIQMVSYLCDAIDEAEDVSNDTKKDLYKHMAESVKKLTPYDFISAAQIISIVIKIERTKLPTDTETAKFMGQSIMNVAATLHDITLLKDTPNVPKKFLLEFVSDCFTLIAKLLKVVDGVKEILEKETVQFYYDSYDDMVSEKVKTRNNLRDLTKNLLISLQILSACILYLDLPNQQPYTLRTESFHFSTRRMTTSYLRSFIALTSKTEIRITQELKQELLSKFKFIDYQFVEFKNSPYWWDKNVEKHNTDFLLFDFFHKFNRIKSVENPMHVFLKARKVPTGSLNGTVTATNKIVSHRITLPLNAMIIAMFEPSSATYKVSNSSCICKDSDFETGLEVTPDLSPYERRYYAQPEKGKTTLYICVKSLGGGEVSYSATFTSFTCLYWNFKISNWDSEGCSVGAGDIDGGDYMLCYCNHASFFTGEIFVPPNQINLPLEFSFYIAVVRNWIMVIVVCVILLIWLLFLMWAWRRDKTLKKKNFVCRLSDNIPGDRYVYLVVVFTGPYLDAETTADVGFQIFGSESNSRAHLIRCWGNQLLQRNTQDWFVMYTPEDLGKVEMIRLWHNCKGTKPHWFCKRIIVQNLKSGAQYCFIINKWFSLIWGDGKIYREIKVKDDPHLKSTKILLRVKFESQIKDKHLWLSIFARDPQSNFSTRERVSCAFCIMLLSMLASAMFFGIPTGFPEDSIDSKTAYYITFREIAIFIESWLVSVPAGIVILLLFRNSSPRKRRRRRRPKKEAEI